jgi:hypothetical protein
MKPHLVIVITYALLITHINKAAQEIRIADTGTQPEVVSKMHAPPGDGVTGLWKLKLEAYDNNHNKILDEAERKKGFQNHYSFRFNADGSCLIQESYKGRYEVKTEGGNKMLYVYRKRVEGVEKQDPPPDVYRIISMSKNELVLLEDLGNLTFWVFERAGS